MSKPPIQSIRINRRNIGNTANSPRTAIQAPSGLMPIAKPRNQWQSQLKRFQYEYESSNSHTGNASAPASGWSIHANTTNKIPFNAKNAITDFRLSRPAGKWRFAVRGFSASNLASAMRLKLMALLRAVTMQSTISTIMRAVSRALMSRKPFAATHMEPIAKGIANSEWLKRTRCVNSRILFMV